MSEEIYKDIVGYEGRYQVSNLGNVKSFINNRWGPCKTGRVLRLKNHSMGYKIVSLGRGNEILVHRLVAQAFLGLDISNTKLEVLHQNDIKTDNRLSNLCLGSHKENMREARERGRMQKGELRWNAKLKDKDIPLIRNLYINGTSLRKIALEFGVAYSTIQLITSGKKWQHIT